MSDQGADLFVDEIDGEHARLMDGETTFVVPRRLLPSDAREGSWVHVLFTVRPSPPNDAENRRKMLGKDDPGGPIKL